VKRTSPCCSRAAPQHDAATPIPHSWEVLRLIFVPMSGFFMAALTVSDGIFTVVFCCCPGVDLYVLLPSVSFLSGMMAVHSRGGYTCVLLFERMNVGPSDVWKLYRRRNRTFFSKLVLLLSDCFCVNINDSVSLLPQASSVLLVSLHLLPLGSAQGKHGVRWTSTVPVTRLKLRDDRAFSVFKSGLITPDFIGLLYYVSNILCSVVLNVLHQ